MKRKFSDYSDTAPWAKPIIIGALWGIAVILMVLMLLALVISLGLIPISACPALASITLALGAFAGGFFAAKKLQKNGIIIGAVCGIILFALFTLIGLAAFKGAPGTPTLIRFLIFLTASAVGGIVGVGNSSKRKIM